MSRHARELFEPVFGDHACVEGGATGDDRDAADLRKVEVELRECDRVIGPMQVGAKCLCDDGRLLENLLLHEVAVVALLDRGGRSPRGSDLAFHLGVLRVEDRRAVARHNDPVTFFEIADLLGQRRERQCVRTDIGFAIGKAHD